MLKLKAVELGTHYPFGYAEGAKPGIQCKVTLEHSARFGGSIELSLSPEATKEVVALAVAKAVEQLAVDVTTIDVDGAPGAPKPQAETALDTAAPSALEMEHI